jgi:hypothetical protein
MCKLRLSLRKNARKKPDLMPPWLSAETIFSNPGMQWVGLILLRRSKGLMQYIELL